MAPPRTRLSPPRPRAAGLHPAIPTQGTWAVNKFNGGVGAASPASATSVRRLLAADDPVSAFFSNFAAHLSGDGDLTSQWAKVQSGAQGLTNATLPRRLHQARAGRAAADSGAVARRRPGRDQRFRGWDARRDRQPDPDHVRSGCGRQPDGQRHSHRAAGLPGALVAVPAAVRRAADDPECADAGDRHPGHDPVADHRGPVAVGQPGRRLPRTARQVGRAAAPAAADGVRQRDHHRVPGVRLRGRRRPRRSRRPCAAGSRGARRQPAGVGVQHPHLQQRQSEPRTSGPAGA